MMPLELKLITAVRARATTLACNRADLHADHDYLSLDTDEIAREASAAYDAFVLQQDEELQCLFRPLDVKRAFIDSYCEQYEEQQMHNARRSSWTDSTGTTRMVSV